MTNAARRDPDRTGYQYTSRNNLPIEPMETQSKNGLMMIIYFIGIMAVVGAFVLGA